MGLLYFTYELLIKNQPNVGKYTSAMDGTVLTIPRYKGNREFLLNATKSRHAANRLASASFLEILNLLLGHLEDHPYLGVSKNRGTPNGWFIMENLIKNG